MTHQLLSGQRGRGSAAAPPVRCGWFYHHGSAWSPAGVVVDQRGAAGPAVEAKHQTGKNVKARRGDERRGQSLGEILKLAKCCCLALLVLAPVGLRGKNSCFRCPHEEVLASNW